MSALSNSLSGAINYLLTIRISDFIDIIIVAYLIYKAIWFSFIYNIKLSCI